ncbi:MULTISPECIES: SGNH/GDSL hydrolase family protein [Burkholderia]|uniref:Acylhydrolase n=1 Tax=Burkholderia savannae TaxID=1637837 RepID=A0ABR5TG88_9BURK|nr:MULTISPECIES: SGNH/GDSL hydrolase family protein [Burkholderia]AOJ69818.1 acylhydrolase [Burkholderia savannae]AOJ81779.1 acylhydrolase [Burkholderia savannae]AOK47948.1 acylhydrolase [Burkholderia sp. MSMB617WGS]KGR97074.1 GDSL-like Lipase/Acylhydrolase family protein [Burkholderia sp. ABCPW 111]KVG41345.1 acylhydrolase [Burkholderia sp. MSMB0265]
MNQPQRQQQPARTARRRLWRGAQVALASAAFAILAACGGGDDNGSSQPSAGVNMQVVSFGDSLSDTGTYSPQILIGFGGGRFTTNPGQVWTQDVAAYYGGTLTPAFEGGFGVPLQAAGGLGYAQGGSRVTQQPGIGHADASVANADYAQATTVPVATQVQQYLQQHGSFNPNQIVLINGGANDIFYQVQVAQAQGNTPAAQLAAAQQIGLAAQQLAGIVQQIVAAGATHVFVSNVPDIGGTPLAVSTDQQAALTQLSTIFNSTLAAALKALNVDPTKAVLIDAFTWQDGITANYQANGFSVSNTGTACNLQSMIAAATKSGVSNPTAFGSSLFCSPQMYTVANADQTYMFADTVHPTTRLHALFAQYVEQQIAKTGVGK